MKSALEHKGTVLIQGRRIILQPFKVSDAFFYVQELGERPGRYKTYDLVSAQRHPRNGIRYFYVGR